MGTKNYDNATDLITFSRASGGTYLDSSGILQTAVTDIPRIDYNPDGTVKGLLIEEARTNLITYSEDFTNAFWQKPVVGITAGAISSPVGLASKATPTATTQSFIELFGSTINITSGQAYAGGYLLKAGELRYAQLIGASAAYGSFAVNFDLLLGEITYNAVSTNAGIIDFGGGWFYCWAAPTALATVSTGRIALNFITTATDGRGSVQTFNGTDGLYVAFSQLEAGSFPTSYIPTSGSTATRAADIASIPVTDFGYNQDQGTVVIKLGTSNGVSAAIGNATFNSDLRFTIDNLARGVGSDYPKNVALGTYSGELNVAVAMKEDAYAGSADGGTVATDTSASMPQNPTLLQIGKDYGGYLNGHIKSIQYYPRRLTDTQLQELTT